MPVAIVSNFLLKWYCGKIFEDPLLNNRNSGQLCFLQHVIFALPVCRRQVRRDQYWYKPSRYPHSQKLTLSLWTIYTSQQILPSFPRISRPAIVSLRQLSGFHSKRSCPKSHEGQAPEYVGLSAISYWRRMPPRVVEGWLIGRPHYCWRIGVGVNFGPPQLMIMGIYWLYIPSHPFWSPKVTGAERTHC